MEAENERTKHLLDLFDSTVDKHETALLKEHGRPMASRDGWKNAFTGRHIVRAGKDDSDPNDERLVADLSRVE